jgi:uncharacterized protein (DUF2252 family)
MAQSAEERTKHGRSRREAVSRVGQANLDRKHRNFDPIQVLRASTEGRIAQLLPTKYARMRISPFAFFRGAVSIMAADLARLPHCGLMVQLCGDAHVQNLGSFAAPDGKLVFDLNDFDETIPGPWEWDVKRMATSIVLAGNEAEHKRQACSDASMAFVASYCRSIAAFARLPILQVARHQIHREKSIQPVHAALLQSQRANPLDLVEKFTQVDAKGGRHFRDARPGFWRVKGPRAKEVLESLGAYRKTLSPERRNIFNLFRPLDVGFKVVGTGSVGLRDYVVLFEGNSPQDPMFLQIKQEVASAYSKYLPGTPHKNQGQRVAEGQRAIQPLSDLLLGWTTVGNHQFLVRQLNDHKGSIDLSQLRGAGLKSLAIVAGELLARGHARSGDAGAIQGYCGEGSKIQRAISAFACEYADLNNADYAAFMAAIKSGKIKAAAPPPAR